MEKLILNGKNLTTNDVWSVAHENRPVDIAPQALAHAAKARQVLFDMAAQGKPVYGLNRGVGWNKDREFDREFFEQYNNTLLRSHSCGVEPFGTEAEVRAIMLVRLNTALCGSTGMATEIIEMYREFLNHGIHPLVPMRGSIGEGDITTLPHIGLAMTGQWEVMYKGQRMPAEQALAAAGLTPVVLGPKDGLSIVCSNAQGAAYAALLVREVEDLIANANVVAALSMEGYNGVLESYDETVNAIRGFPGQCACGKECLSYLEGSYLHQPHPERALQDPLTFRGAHAINGTVLDALDYLRQHLMTQLNTPDDNPCIVADEGRTSVSTNFEVLSWVIGVEMVGIALAHLSRAIAMRTLKFADPAFTHLPRFLTPDEVKVIAFGTIQKTFTALDGENRMLANPSSLDWLPVAGYIEDHASNAPLASQKVLRLVDNLRYLLGIEAMHAAQAIDFRKGAALGLGTKAAYAAVREVLPFLEKDRILTKDIKTMYELVRSGRMVEAARGALAK